MGKFPDVKRDVPFDLIVTAQRDSQRGLNEFQSPHGKNIALRAFHSGTKDDDVIKRMKEAEPLGSEVVRTSILVLKHWLSMFPPMWETTRAPSSYYIELLTLRCAEENPQGERSHLFGKVLKSIISRENFVLQNEAGEDVGVWEDHENLVKYASKTLKDEMSFDGTSTSASADDSTECATPLSVEAECSVDIVAKRPRWCDVEDDNDNVV